MRQGLKVFGELLVTLLFIFGLVFGISVLFHPEWLGIPNWPIRLSSQIVAAAGYTLIPGFLLWLMTKLIVSKNITELIYFYFGRKYKNIESTVNKFTILQIDKEKNSRRYIPAVFIETIDVKERLRYFTEPFKFYPKVVDIAKRDIGKSLFITTLHQIHYPIDEIYFPKLGNKNNLNLKCELACEALDEYSDMVNIVGEKAGRLKEEHLERIPNDKKHIYTYHYVNLEFFSSYERVKEEAKKNFKLLSDNVALITGRAGHGKTNLICNFTENFLLKKGKLCLYFTGRDFNQMEENETIEEAISRIVFSETDFKFSDILNLTRLDNNHDFLFIVIDGLNEHTNLIQFALSLEQLIQRCNDKNVMIILTCRSEYYEERFGKLSKLSNLSILPMEGFGIELSETHQDYLIEQYFQHFKIPLDLGSISGHVIEVFSEDKLMLRFFCEAYEGVDNLPAIHDIYRFAVFENYLKKKAEAIEGLFESLTEIIRYMVSNSRFSNIHLQDLSEETQAVIENAIYENVIVRKDLVKVPGIALGNQEVVNFVYDEFREYLLASHLVIDWHHDNLLARTEIERLVQATFPIAEGLQRYLCSWSIENQDNNLLDLLSQFDLFESVFIEIIFQVPDELITGTFLEILRNFFWQSNINARKIIIALIYRCNPEFFPNLNIGFLFEQISIMNGDQYLDLIQTGLVPILSFETTPMNSICNAFIIAFQNNRINDESRSNILRLFLSLSGIEDTKWLDRYDDLDRYPAMKTIELIKGYYSNKEFISILKECQSTIQVESVKEAIGNLLDQYGG